jgi:UDP-N-acetylmuramyl tripeptide synthase
MILNADDPLVAVVGQGRARVRYFGVLKDSRPVSKTGVGAAGHGQDAVVGDGRIGRQDCIPVLTAGTASTRETREGRFCQRCGTALTYNYFHFGQLGDYFCSNCGFRRPELDYAAWDISEDELLCMSVSIRGASASAQGDNAGAAAPGGGTAPLRKFGQQMVPDGGHRELKLIAPLRGFYNVYNILAATAAAQELGVSGKVIQSAVRSYKPATGRMEDFLFAGRRCTLALIKNPVGANEVLKTLIRAGGAKALVIAISDLAADGRDVSWLWDADFACLADPSVGKVICSGLRAADFAVCLKYAGVPLERIEVAPERSASLGRLAAQQADKLYVLATYTNLFDYARLLGRLGSVVEQHAH